MVNDAPGKQGGLLQRGAAGTDRRTLLISAACNWLGFAASVAIAFVMCPVLVQGLGDDRYGVWSLVGATVGWFALLDMGIGAAVVRYVAHFGAAEDDDQLNRVFSTSVCIFALAGAIALLGCILLAVCWQCPFGLPDELALTTRWLFVLLGATVGAELVVGNFGSVLYGLGRFPAKVSVEAGVRAAAAVGIYVLVRHGGGLIGIAIISLGAVLIRGVLQGALVRAYLPKLRLSPRLASWDTFRTIRGYSFRAFAIMIAGRVSYRIDPIVIGAFLAPKEITYFAVAAQLVDYAKTAVSSLCQVLTPSAAALQARGDWEKLRSAHLEASRWVQWLAVPIVAGLVAFGKPFFSLWLSPAHAERAYPVLIVLGAPLIVALSQIAGSRLLYGLGRLRKLTWLAILEACANLLLSVISVRSYGILGVAFGTALPSIAYSITVSLLTCRHLGTRIVDYYRAVLVGPFLLGVPLAALWCSWNILAPPTEWTSLVVAGAVGALLYLPAVFALEAYFRRTTDTRAPARLSPTEISASASSIATQ